MDDANSRCARRSGAQTEGMNSPMNLPRRSWFWLVLVFVTLAPAALTAVETDTVLLSGLRACDVNDLRTCIRTWYAHDPKLNEQVQNQLEKVSAGLGDILGTEIVSARDLSKRVRRYYIAVYFDKHPLWLRVDRYNTNGVVQITLPLKYSLAAGEILPRDWTGE